MIDRLLNNMVDALKDSTVGHAAQKKLSRRDFLKVAGAVTGSAILAACVPGTVTSPTEVGPQNPTALPPPKNTLSPEGKTFQGTIDKSKSTQIQADFLNTYTAAGSLGVTKDNSIGFSIDALNQDSDFVLRYSPTESPYKNLFIKTTLGWAEMAQVQIGQNDELYVGIKKETRARMGWVLLYAGGGQSEPVISLTQLEQGDWEKMTDQQRNAYSLIFTPPPDLRPNYSGYDFKKDKIVVTEVQSVGGLVAMPLAVRTPEPTKAPTTAEQLARIPERSMGFISKEDSLDNQLAINQVEAQRLYSDEVYSLFYSDLQQLDTKPFQGGELNTDKHVPNKAFIQFIKDNFNGYDITQIADRTKFNEFLDILKNSKKDPKDPNDPGYWVPAGMPILYYMEDGSMEIRPGPEFCIGKILLQVWKNKTYLQKDSNKELKPGEVMGMGINYHRWGFRFVTINGQTYLSFLLTGGKADPVYGDSPVTQSDVDWLNNDLGLFKVMTDNTPNARKIPKKKNRFVNVTTIGNKGMTDAEGIDAEGWTDNGRPTYQVFTLP